MDFARLPTGYVMDFIKLSVENHNKKQCKLKKVMPMNLECVSSVNLLSDISFGQSVDRSVG